MRKPPHKHARPMSMERTVFFCDAVVAIAITLLALDLKIEPLADGHLSFPDFIEPWPKYLTFILSFINIASFWKNHHTFFTYIKKMDDRLLWFNLVWLFFIAVLPFTTSLLSSYFFDSAAMVLYCANTLLLTILQNAIWDYSAWREDYMEEENSNPDEIKRLRMFCNLDMLNALVAVVIAFFSPLTAFILLLTKLPMIMFVGLYFLGRGKKGRGKGIKN